MAEQKKQSALASILGAALDKEVQQHAGDETQFSRQTVPGGIKDGIAKLEKIVFDKVAPGKQNAGKVYCRMEATCIYPEQVLDPETQVMVKCKGKVTGFFEMLCDTKTQAIPPKLTTRAEHLASVLNEFRKLGADTSTMTKGSDIENVAKELCEAGVLFRFTTRFRPPSGKDPKTGKPYPAKVDEYWNGAIAPEELPDGIEIGTGTGVTIAEEVEDPANADGALDDTVTPPEAAVDGDGGDDGADGDAVIASDGDETWEDLVAQFEALDAGPAQDEVIAKLVAMAVAAGVDEDAAKEAETWADVAAMIEAAGEAADEPEPEPEPTPPPIPKKGDVGKVKVEKVVKGKKQKADVTVEVLTVSTKNKTVTVKDKATGKMIAGADGKATAFPFTAFVV